MAAAAGRVESLGIRIQDSNSGFDFNGFDFNGEGGLSPDSQRDLAGRGDIQIDVAGRDYPKTSPKNPNRSKCKTGILWV
jgi:hypothetical protein